MHTVTERDASASRRSSRLYEKIGQRYDRVRYADPRIRASIHQALGDAETVLNVGAGTGNYEPTDRRTIAVDPAAVMLGQRPPAAAQAIRAAAEALPFRDACFDSALAINTVHHWQHLAGGLRELCRVARQQIVFMCEPAIGRSLWVLDYFPEARGLPSEGGPCLTDVCAHLAVVSVTTIPVAADCPDGFTAAYWRRPEAYLEADVRAGMSPLAQLPLAAIARGVNRLRRDLQSGRWDRRHGHLRALSEYDAGYRLVVAGSDP